MGLEQYIVPLTYAEYMGVTWSFFTNKDYAMTLAFMAKIRDEVDPESIIWEPYGWPKDIDEEFAKKNYLKSFQSQVQGITFSMDYFPDKKDSNVHEKLAEVLKPEQTFERSNGDCKCLSIMAVTYMRALEIPTRFYISRKDHIIVESYAMDGRDFWERWDPDPTLCSVQGFSVKGEFDDFYENLLKIIK
jgi:hypothetical protein